uniref:AFTRAX n=1 Tax=Archaeoglobus fulgidus TaxID=2234 RepID=UPI0002AB7F60|nr:Chain A, AFTRAX [Archaeoglobus fulgidus]3ZC0_B Chain B, AFTRAX [Archaeoglobus fulgidus]3ZC0_C Chain C, AFTRAX [Archaeoglobus fulgidus]3ZC0_D Chain D, AFTRAX [Archaeoglobus fulgidus]3ZC0_E Chain E, AFTRAX [Archaeoglobus fulgidus]3ZC0_F Chain F, AFTRAX [Archaeoglobus fulgidus]3ZC0_G Chain G, AFTRAX [Archaeoglobus fulgidus]3ZC0_H Chain H, AFTRAX [Archaeoglobus fulgidus]3ZC0_I Chain I, AFTRAX [Archaeoglobus fulgidus]3ZC0_J Chain J, AFTRAX [Archaeoglobus fulgidus]3ZC0_K Chain K, AFTRAX [Arc
GPHMRLEECRKRLEELEAAREELLKVLREMRIHSTKSIALIHAGKVEEAEQELKKAIELLEKVKAYREYPEIYFYLCNDAMQELVEAIAFKNAISGEFTFEIDLEVTPAAFLNGFAAAVGELRRYALTKLIEGDFKSAERMLEVMEKIYERLMEFTTFPDKLVSGLRKKLDVARGGIERTKSDYIAAKVARLNESLGGN